MSNLLRAARLAFTVVLTLAAAAVPAHAASPCQGGVRIDDGALAGCSFAGPGTGTVVVPDAVADVHAVATGGHGGHFTGTAIAGQGAQVSGQLAVPSSHTLTVQAAGNAWDWKPHGDQETSFGGGGAGCGGGGGASGVFVTNAAGTARTAALLIAAGGGGAGCPGDAAHTEASLGGDAGQPGTNGYPAGTGGAAGGAGTASAPGAGGESGSGIDAAGPGTSGGSSGAFQEPWYLQFVGPGGRGGGSGQPARAGGGGGAGHHGGGGGGGAARNFGGWGSGGGGGGGSNLVPAGGSAGLSEATTTSVTVTWTETGPIPVNSAPPRVSGTARVGETLTALPGTWSGVPTRVVYEWLRCHDSSGTCAEILGKQAETYVVSTADTGKRIRVRETAVNSHGMSYPADSSPSEIVAAISPAPTASPSPTTTPSPAGTDATTLGALLRDQLTPRGRAARIRNILAAGGYPLHFKTPVAGRVRIEWLLRPTRRGAPLVRLASGVRTFPAPGTARIVLRLTRTGRRVLARNKRVRLVARGVFAPAGGSPVSAEADFALRR